MSNKYNLEIMNCFVIFYIFYELLVLAANLWERYVG